MKLSKQIEQEILDNPKYLHGKYHELAVKYGVSAENIRSVARKLRKKGVESGFTTDTQKAVSCLIANLTKSPEVTPLRKTFDEMIANAFPAPEPEKFLFLDIETSPNICFSWSIGNKISLTPDNILTERAIICISYKWAHETSVHTLKWQEGNDKQLLEDFTKVLKEADYICGHNIDAFDIKHIFARCIRHGIPVERKYKSIDTLKLARRYFRFNSNKLNYLGQFLKLGEKIHTDYSLWKKIVLQNDPQAMIDMCLYCEQDVLLLEQVYKELHKYRKIKK